MFVLLFPVRPVGFPPPKRAFLVSVGRCCCCCCCCENVLMVFRRRVGGTSEYPSVLGVSVAPANVGMIFFKEHQVCTCIWPHECFPCCMDLQMCTINYRVSAMHLPKTCSHDDGLGNRQRKARFLKLLQLALPECLNGRTDPRTLLSTVVRHYPRPSFHI